MDVLPARRGQRPLVGSFGAGGQKICEPIAQAAAVWAPSGRFLLVAVGVAWCLFLWGRRMVPRSSLFMAGWGRDGMTCLKLGPCAVGDPFGITN